MTPGGVTATRSRDIKEKGWARALHELEEVGQVSRGKGKSVFYFIMRSIMQLLLMMLFIHFFFLKGRFTSTGESCSHRRDRSGNYLS